MFISLCCGIKITYLTLSLLHCRFTIWHAQNVINILEYIKPESKVIEATTAGYTAAEALQNAIDYVKDELTTGDFKDGQKELFCLMKPDVWCYWLSIVHDSSIVIFSDAILVNFFELIFWQVGDHSLDRCYYNKSISYILSTD